ncbi:hypothetical protein [Methylorubrum sp. SB2]|uniref:hypothetical protein n=1 Tax=Methylorubrum subtropicum TaxID=3138812 RepID=UPI00313E178E
MTSLNTTASGSAGNGTVTEALALNGTSVVFVSTSSNLVAGDTNGVADVFLRNLKTGEITLLSKSASGAQANGASGGLDVSADGSRILFSSKATNLTSAGTAGFENVYVKDIATGAVTLVSATASDAAGNGDSTAGVFSPDGRSVAFQSTASNLVADDTNGVKDVFLKTLDGGAIASLSSPKEGGSAVEVPVTDKPAFSADGGIVTFGSYSYAIDDAGFVIFNVSTNFTALYYNDLSVSKGDGTAATVYPSGHADGFDWNITFQVSLDYDRDGDFWATLTAQNLIGSGSRPDVSESFLVKVRAHSGAQNFVGDGTGELVLLSSANDKADGGGGDDTLYGYRGADDLSGGAGNDVLDGGFGDDILRGGIGDDTYYIDSPSDRIVEAAGAGRDTAIASYSATLAANVEDLKLTGFADLTGTGNALGNVITGNFAANTLYGLDGDDVLDGGDGLGNVDRLIGGAGNDTYHIYFDIDVIEEQAGGGIDTVISSADLTLGANVENLTLIEGWAHYETRGGRDGTGNALDNVITGNSFRNTLTGLDGDDTLIGGGADDELLGGAGNDLLDGGTGADRMTGGSGNDTYVIDDAGDQMFESAGRGTDTLRTSISYALAPGHSIEILKLAGTASINLTGNELANTLTDNAGNNLLNGGGGGDRIFSTGGVDTLIGGGDDASAVIDRSGATAALSFVMTSAGGTTTLVGDGTTTQGIGNLTLIGGSGNDRFLTLDGTDTLNGGAGDDKLTSGAGDDTLNGGAGNDTLEGGTGTDRMTGGAGNDLYLVDSSTDRVFETAGGGSDRIFSTSHYALAGGQEVEGLSLLASTGTARLNLAGNEFGQTLVGNAGANGLEGKGGNDVLTGGRGADSFVFATALGAGNVDRITDFAAEDRFLLGKTVFSALAPGQLAESAFKNLDRGAVDADDRILYKQSTGEVFYDADGSGNGAAVKFAVLDNKAALTAADFVV